MFLFQGGIPVWLRIETFRRGWFCLQGASPLRHRGDIKILVTGIGFTLTILLKMTFKTLSHRVTISMSQTWTYLAAFLRQLSGFSREINISHFHSLKYNFPRISFLHLCICLFVCFISCLLFSEIQLPLNHHLF